ncbi:MAG: ABC transporter ATP-binding protein/permease [Clostridia bacterium]|nr:ABC transporter ATP-binding protein/permease [Clostridia bacterium]
MAISKEDKQLLKRLLRLLHPYRKSIIIVLFCVLASAGIEMIMPLIAKELMDKGLLAKNIGMVVRFVLITLSLLFVEQAIGFLETKYYAYINTNMPYNLTKTTLKQLFKLKIQYFKESNLAEIMNNTSMDVANISSIVDRNMFFLITSVFRIIGGLVGLILIDWKLTLLVILIMPVRILVVKYLASKRKKLFEDLMQYSMEYASWYGDTLGGIREIKLWGLERIMVGHFIKKQRNVLKTNIRLAFLDKYNQVSETVIFQIITNSLYIFGAYLTVQNSLTLGGLLAFITYSVYVTAPISAIINIGYNFSGILPSAKRLFGLLDMETEGCGSVTGKHLTKKQTEGNILFENISFGYRKGELLLKNINLEILKGEKVAIVGANGSGKSTLFNLILRFYEQDEGRILLDGTDIREINLKDYRRLLSVVSQDVYLFNAGIRENIALFSKRNEVDIQRALKESGADKILEGYHGKAEIGVGSSGAMLSGGERQKIAVARAFAHDFNVLLMDEATSQFDLESEAKLNHLISKQFVDKTVLIITHRPDILKTMDKVVVLENGKIVDIGKHEDLCSRNDFYREMLENKVEVSGVHKWAVQ